jgi:hypothetical protein
MLASVLLFGGDDFFISTSSELESTTLYDKVCQ